MKTNKTNILRGALSSIVAFTILASAAASQAATPQGTSPITWTTRGKPSGNSFLTPVPRGAVSAAATGDRQRATSVAPCMAARTTNSFRS